MENGEIIVADKKYVPAKEASLQAGYSHDYITKLCRSGSLTCTQIARIWFVEELSLQEFVASRQEEKEAQHEELSRQRREEYRRAIASDSVSAGASGFSGQEFSFIAGVWKQAVALAIATAAVGVPAGIASTSLGQEIQANVTSVGATVVLTLDAVPEVVSKVARTTAVRFAEGAAVLRENPAIVSDRIHSEFFSTREHVKTFATDVARHATELPTLTKASVDAALFSIATLPQRVPSMAHHGLSLLWEMPGVVASSLRNADRGVHRGVNVAAVTFDESVRNLEAPFVRFIHTLSLSWYRTVNDTIASLQSKPTADVLSNEERNAITDKLRLSVAPEAPLVQTESPDREGIRASLEPVVTTEARPSTQTTVVNQPVVERVIERIVSVPSSLSNLSEEEVSRRLAILEAKLDAKIFNLEGRTTANTTNIVNNYTNISQTNKIDDLGSVTIHDSSITASSFSGTSVSADQGSFDALNVSGNAVIGGTLTAQSIGAVLDLLSVPRIAATSTTGTSTFAADVAFDTNTLYVDSINNRVGVGTSTPGLRFSVAGNLYGDGNLTIGGVLATGTVTATNFVATSASATSTLAGGLAIETSGLVYDFSTNNVGIGTASPTQKLSVSGNAFITGGLGIGIATTTSGVLETTGNAYIGGNLTVVGDSVVIGGSTADSLTINSTINSNLIPDQNATRDIGSPSFFWDDGYFDNITANNLSAASTTIAGTQSATFTINSDNATSDAEDSDLIFFRGGSITPNALISWNSTLDLFDINQPLFIQNDSSTTTIVTLDVKGTAGQTANLFRVASSSGTTFFSIASDGTLTTSGLATLGNLLLTGSSTLQNFTFQNATGTNATTTNLAVSGEFTATNASATTTLAGGLAVETSGLVYDFSTNRVGIGTASPLAQLQVSTVAGSDSFRVGSSTTQFVVDRNGNVGIGTTTPNNTLTIYDTVTPSIEFSAASGDTDKWTFGIDTADAGKFKIASSTAVGTNTRLTIDGSGHLGLGVTDPANRLEVFDTVADAQLKVSYDATRFTDFQVDSVGDLVINPQGDDVFLNDDNLWVCTGGSCPSGTPAVSGSLIVESRIGIGTSTPGNGLTIAASTPQIQFTTSGAGGNAVISVNQNVGEGGLAFRTGASLDRLRVFQDGTVAVGASSSPAITGTGNLAVVNDIYVGNGGGPSLGTATSTFEGDIIIHGKLDVSTIDPVYTIGGVKYATYGHSTVGIKEETTETLTIDQLNPETGYYETSIVFSDTEKGSDLWLFYQVTDFGRDWRKLVVTLTPGTDGRVFYTKDAEANTLTISSTKPGEVSMRLVADRFDASKWPNLRPDQGGGFAGFQLDEKQ